jgi:heptosyltransferase III
VNVGSASDQRPIDSTARIAEDATVLLLHPWGIGDGLLLLPALHQLRRLARGIRIVLAAHGSLGPLVRPLGLCDEFLPKDDAAVTALFAFDGGYAAGRHWEHLDDFVGWLYWRSPALLRNLAALGVARPTIIRPVPNDLSEHVAHHLWSALRAMGVEPPDAGVEIGLDPGCRWDWRADPRAGPARRPRVAIGPGSSEGEKNWPIEAFCELAGRLTSELRAEVTMMIGPAEIRVRRRIFNQAARHGWHVLDTVPLDQIADQLTGQHLYIGNDSGLAHLAGLIGVPTLVLFGPTDPSQWRPLGPRVAVLRARPIAHLGLEVVWARTLQMLG